MEDKQENKHSAKRSFSFKKEERLCSKKIIDRLFSEGESFLIHPLKFVFLKTELPASVPVQVGFSVGKKIFKKAVQRNLLKRRMREAYRLNKHELYPAINEVQSAVFIIYIGKEIADYHTVEQALKRGIKKLSKSNFVQDAANR